MVRIFVIISAFLMFAFGSSPLNSKAVSEWVEDSVTTKEVILQKAQKRLISYFGPASDDYRFELSPRWIPQHILQSRPEAILSVELEGRVDRYTDFRILYRDRHNRKQKVQIQLGVELEQKLPVVVRRIRSGEKIKKIDLRKQWVSLVNNRGDLVENMEEISGKTLRRTLLAGQPIRSSYLSREYIIEVGDQVTLIIEKKGVRAQLAGEARENGAKGDRINMYSEETRKKYVGEVIRPGVLKWKNTLQ